MSYFFLKGGGTVSEEIISLDWKNNPLGAIEHWPQGLKTSLNICLNSAFPIFIAWGPQLIMFYNDTYTDLLDRENNFGGLGKPVKEFWAEIWDTIGPLINSVISTGQPVKLEDHFFSLKRKGEKEDRYFTFSFSPIWDEKGISGVMNVAVETTEKVLNARRVKLEHEKTEQFFNQVPAAVCILDGPELKFKLANPAYQKLFPGRNLIGKKLLEALPEIKNTSIHEILLDVYHTGRPFEGKELLVPLSRFDDAPLENLYFNFIYQARWNTQQQIDGIEVFAYEVTDLVTARHSAEQLALKVEQQAKVFDITLAAIKDFIYTFDIDGRFTYSNKPLLDLLGISLDQIIGKNFHDLPYPSELAHSLQSEIAQVIVSGKPTKNETFYTNPLGKTGYYEYIFTPVFDGEGNVVLVAGSTRDISERKKSEESIWINNKELVNVNNELTRVNSDLDNFIYAASHDLKTPISNIEGLITALTKNLSKETFENPTIVQLLQMIQASIDRFNKTIQDLADITKLQRITEGGEVNIDIYEVVEDIEMDLSLIIQESKAKINIELNDIGEFKFSYKNIRSVFYNLISNSLKYKYPGRDPVVNIVGKNHPDFNILTVQDNGLGMDLSQEDSVFGMFKRLHNHVEGSGIGLFIVKKIMENAGGKIEVKSKVGVGSIFTLIFAKSR